MDAGYDCTPSQGAGDLVVCLHASAGTHSQSQGLANTLSRHWQVLLSDLHGHGKSPQPPSAMMNAAGRLAGGRGP